MCVCAWACPMCIYPSEKPCPCTAHVELVMNFIARKPPEGRVVSCKKKMERNVFLLKSPPSPIARVGVS